jgi:glucose dehydrogenase
MAQTYIGSTLRTGSGTLTDTVDGGFVVTAQTTTVTTVSAGTAVSSTITIPASSQIINFFIDCTTLPVVGGGTATTVPITIGTAAAGTQYLSATDCIAGGRAALTFTAAQLTAMSDVGANQSVVVTVDPNGTISTTQGVYRLTVVYAQKV